MEEAINSQESITQKVERLDLQSSESEKPIESSQDVQTTEESENTDANTSTSSSSPSTAIEEAEKPMKRKRKRKRKRKQKNTTAHVPIEPFIKRYKNVSLDFEVSKKPKLHIKFDENGDLDEKLSKFNYKPRIIKALAVNLTVNDIVKNKNEACQQTVKELENEVPELVISLKPRIIKALGT